MIIHPKQFNGWGSNANVENWSVDESKTKCKFLKSLLLEKATLKVFLKNGRSFVGTFVGTDRKARVLLAHATEHLPITFVDGQGKPCLYPFAHDFVNVSKDLKPRALPKDFDLSTLDPIERSFGLVVLPGEQIAQIEKSAF